MGLAHKKLACYFWIVEMSGHQTFIIGGGFTGLATANLISKSNITLIEATKNLGGILRDCEFQNNQFFSSCQYINQSLSLFEDMGLRNEFYEFSHSYASYTDLFNTETIATDFVGPVFDGDSLDVKVRNTMDVLSVSDRCDLYPSEIGKNFKKWFSFIGVDVSRTHHSSVVGFQSSRVYAKKHTNEVLKLKKNDKQVDMLYGVPRSVLGLPDINAFLPKNGFSQVFEKLSIQNKKNINILTKTTVNCEKRGDEIFLRTKNERIRPDLVIWTADPTKLIASLYNKTLDSLMFRGEIISGFLHTPITSPFYIQVYSMKSRVLRIFLYQIENRSCYTIEKAFDEQPNDEILDFSQKILDKMVNVQFGPVLLRKKNARYFAYSIEDHKVLQSLYTQDDVCNLIVPDYLSYGRDQKIKSLNDQLN